MTIIIYRKTKLTSRIYLLFNVELMVKKTTFLARSNLKKWKVDPRWANLRHKLVSPSFKLAEELCVYISGTWCEDLLYLYDHSVHSVLRSANCIICICKLFSLSSSKHLISSVFLLSEVVWQALASTSCFRTPSVFLSWMLFLFIAIHLLSHQQPVTQRDKWEYFLLCPCSEVAGLMSIAQV